MRVGRRSDQRSGRATSNFSGFPSSADASCKAFVGNFIDEGFCGDVDLTGVKAIAIIDWPKAIHDGGGKAVFVVEPDTTDEQIDCLAKIYTGALGGNPWGILGSTFEVAGLVKDAHHPDGLRPQPHAHGRRRW